MAHIISILRAAYVALEAFCSDKAAVALWPNGPTGQQYWQGVSRRNPDGSGRGSYVDEVKTSEDVYALINSLTSVEEFTPEVGAMAGCRYFKAAMPAGYNASIGAISLDEALDLGLAVRLVDGAHGKELVADSNVKVGALTLTFIVEGTMLSTWYPGLTFVPMPHDVINDPTTWVGEWAVKLQ